MVELSFGTCAPGEIRCSLIAGIHLFFSVANTGLDESVERPEYASTWQPIITKSNTAHTYVNSWEASKQLDVLQVTGRKRRARAAGRRSADERALTGQSRPAQFSRCDLVNVIFVSTSTYDKSRIADVDGPARCDLPFESFVADVARPSLLRGGGSRLC